MKNSVVENGLVTGITRVRWSSAAGILEGLVERFDYARNAAGDMIPFVWIKRVDGHTTRLAYTKANMAMLKMEII